MLEFLAQLVFEVLGEALLQLFVEVGLSPLAHAFRPKRSSNPALAGLGLFVVGALAGLIASLVLPERLSPPSRFRGWSMVLSPLLVGGVMEWFGRWRNSPRRSALTTFWGAALFAFAFALVRYLMVGRAM